MFAQQADIHLPVSPGTDLVLLNALAHVILEEGLADIDYINAHTTGYEEFRTLVKQYDPESAATICGIDADTIRKVARIYAAAGAAMTIWTMGINQSTHGSDGVCAINNLSLITGNIGKPGGSSLSITGQCNAMGTREWSSCSGLPGYRALESEQDRSEIAEFWGIQHGSYARLASRRGDAIVMVQCTERIAPDSVFIPFHYHECVNRLALGLLDPHSRQPAYKQCAVMIEAIDDQQAAAQANVAARAF